MVPPRARASSQAAAAAGVTVRAIPSSISPPKFCSYQSIEVAAGQRPRPLIVSTRRAAASQVMIGATPPKLVRCGSSTLMQRPTATPASVALPPALRISTPAAVAR